MKFFNLHCSAISVALCLLFYLVNFTTPLSAQCPPPAPGNLVGNFSFEVGAAGCVFPALGYQMNNAFVGCVATWSTGVGTPSLCNTIAMPGGGSGAPIITAANGTFFACLGADGIGGGCLNNESIIQTVNLCSASTYMLSFQYNNLRNSNGNLSIQLTNAVPAACAIPTVNLILPTIHIVPAILGGGAPAWVTVNVPIPAALLGNTQLIFTVNPDAAITGKFDIGLDNISITCQQTPLIPQINVIDNGNGSYDFNGATNVVSGVGVSSWCWTFGDGTSASGQNVSHSYAAGGTYTVCLTVADNCGGCTSMVCTNVTYDNCPCGNNSIVLSAGDPFPTFMFGIMDEDVILLPGVHTSIINQSLYIKTTCKIVVMRGASLTVDNSTLTSYCEGQKWQGIVVWGNSSVNHSSVSIPANATNDPGIALIQNQSLISEAQTALEPQRWWSDSRNATIFAPYTGAIMDYWGGIVQATDSRFYNNRKSADIGAYFTGWDNACEFTRCTFTSSATSPSTGMGAEGVNLWNNLGVAFVDDVFDIVPARGITAIDAAFSVNNCDFLNNYTGIQIGAIAAPTLHAGIGTGTIADQNNFRDNSFGVAADGSNNLSVLGNYFASNVFSGLRTSGSTASIIKWNDFELNDKGITLMNTGSIGQYLDCNNHYYDNWGAFASANCLGVKFKNNTYEDITADILLQGLGGVSGQLPPQGAQNQSVLNYFSTGESNNDIVTDAPTIAFNYYPPAVTAPELVANPTLIPRTLPTCDSDDGCLTGQNYLNYKRTGGSVGCTTRPTGDDGGGHDGVHGREGGCVDKECLDALNDYLNWLKEQIASGNEEYVEEAQLTESDFLSDKRYLVEQWFLNGDMDMIEQTLGAYGETDDKKLLFGFYIRLKDMDQAAAVLESIPGTSTDDIWFKEVQQIYMAFLNANEPYLATPEQDVLLETAGTSILPVGANARALYYLLHGIWLEPILEVGNREIPSNNKASTTFSLLPVPNPADNGISVQLPANTGTLQLCNSFGKMLRTFVVSDFNIDINTAMLPNGIYLLQYVALDGARSKSQLVIQH